MVTVIKGKKIQIDFSATFLFQFVLLFSYFHMWSCSFDQFHDNKSSFSLWNSSVAVIVLDVKDQTEYFMEKGEIRKYIPFLKLYSSVSAFFIVQEAIFEAYNTLLPYTN